MKNKIEQWLSEMSEFQGLSVRSRNLLLEEGYKTKEEVREDIRNGRKIYMIKGCGVKTHIEVCQWVGLDPYIYGLNSCRKKSLVVPVRDAKSVIEKLLLYYTPNQLIKEIEKQGGKQ